MIQSMTGYGKASAEFQGKKINAEVKSLNSKALDLSTRLAPIYREKEMEVRVLIAQALERGKVEFNLWIEQTEAQNAASINGELVANYYKQITDIAEKYDIDEPEDIWTVLMRMPDVLSKTEIQELTDEEWAVAKSVVEKAIQQLVDFRIQEGRALQKQFRGGAGRRRKQADRIPEPSFQGTAHPARHLGGRAGILFRRGMPGAGFRTL